MDSVTPYLSGLQEGEQLQQQPTNGVSPSTSSRSRPEINRISPHRYNMSSPSSPHGALGNNTSLKSELEKIRIQDHYTGDQPEMDDADPDNIDLASLLSKMRQIRSSGQIQYRIPKKRKQEKAPAEEDAMDIEGAELSDDLETVTIYRQKRVRKTPKGPRSVPYDKEKRRRKSHKEGRPSRPHQTIPTIETPLPIPTETPLPIPAGTPLPIPTETSSLPTAVYEEPPIDDRNSVPRQ